MVAVGDVIGYLEASPKHDGAAVSAPVKPTPQPAKPAEARAAATPPATKAAPEPQPDIHPHHADVAVSPAARRALREHGLTAADVEPTGATLSVSDVQRHLDELTAKPPAAKSAESAPPAPALKKVDKAEESQPPAPRVNGELEEVVPMSLIRRCIAERLVNAQQQAALLTTFNEIDMSAVKALRAEYQEAFQAKYGTKLGFMSFFVKAVIDALKSEPALNAEIRDNKIVYRHYYDIGIAVSSTKGLVVPVLRSADRLSFAEIEQSISDFGKRASANKLDPADLEGGTFTITNGGIFGSLLSTPIVNPPQSGVLGMHAIQDRPVAREGQVVIRPMMYVALTYDHRLVDGREAVTFLVRVKQTLEDPSRMLLEV
jgi:2-oxoglutarate dehydrogenase E2 component (dihydrolipoamide succinyltransferase)